MRGKLGVLLMEDEDGKIAVQMFAEPNTAESSFDNLVGRVGQKPQRATFLKIQYDGELKVEAKAKTLPVAEDITRDAFRLGEGWVKVEDGK